MVWHNILESHNIGVTKITRSSRSHQAWAYSIWYWLFGCFLDSSSRWWKFHFSLSVVFRKYIFWTMGQCNYTSNQQFKVFSLLIFSSDLFNIINRKQYDGLQVNTTYFIRALTFNFIFQSPMVEASFSTDIGTHL